MSDGKKIGCVIALVVVLIIVALFLNPLILMWGWNYGVCAAIGAASPIGYWTAFWICAVLGVIGSYFKPSKIKLNMDE